MKNYFLLTALMLMSGLIFAQNESSDVDLAEHKIVFQLTSGDTNVHKMLVRQLGNVLTAAPNSKIEVVCHGPGITMLTTRQTIVHPKVSELKGKGIDFVVCENTLRCQTQKSTYKENIPTH